MISLPAMMLATAQKSRSWIRRFAFSEMQQIARGWGLDGDFPAPEKGQRKPLDLNFSERSRRTLSRKGLRINNLTSSH